MSSFVKKYDNEDHRLWLKISDKFKCYHIDIILGEYIYHAANRSNRINLKKGYEHIVKLRWNMRTSRSERLSYINESGIDVIQRLLFACNAIDYAYFLSKEFSKIAKNHVSLACAGFCAMAERNYERTIHYLKRSLRSFPYYYSGSVTARQVNMVRLNLAKTLYYVNDLDEARKLYIEILKSEPQNIHVRQMFARCCLRLK